MSAWMLFLLMFCAFGWLGRRGNRWRAHEPLARGDDETRRELARVREMVEDLSSRFHVLETERDFYRELLSAPETRTLRGPSDPPPGPAPSEKASQRSTEPGAQAPDRA